MGSPTTFRAVRPVSILLAIVLLAVSYVLGSLPSESLEHSSSKNGSSATAASDTGVPVDAADRVESSELLHGLLRKTSGREYLSPAGLIYGPGSAEGHRLDHLERHTKDDPGRPGSHGVFDGGMTGALKTIDLAYERAKSGQRTTTQTDDGRTIHTVDLGKRVGFVGGSEGQRRGHPMARRVRLVLEGKRVVTAFPM